MGKSCEVREDGSGDRCAPTLPGTLGILKEKAPNQTFFFILFSFAQRRKTAGVPGIKTFKIKASPPRQQLSESPLLQTELGTEGSRLDKHILGESEIMIKRKKNQKKHKDALSGQKNEKQKIWTEDNRRSSVTCRTWGKTERKARGKTQRWKEDVRIGGSGGAGPLSLFVALRMGKLKQTRSDRSAAFKPLWLYSLGEGGKKVGKGWAGELSELKARHWCIRPSTTPPTIPHPILQSAFYFPPHDF